MSRPLHELLLDVGACEGAREYLRKFEPDATLQEAWDNCKSPAWMFWLIGRCRPDTQDGMRALLGFYLALWDRMFPDICSVEALAFLRLVREVAESPDISLHRSRSLALTRDIPRAIRWASGYNWSHVWVAILDAVVEREARGLASHEAFSAIEYLLVEQSLSTTCEPGREAPGHRSGNWDSICGLIRLLHPLAPDLSLAEDEGPQR